MELGRPLVGGRLPALCPSDGRAGRGELPLLALARVRPDGAWCDGGSSTQGRRPSATTLRSTSGEAPLGPNDLASEVVDPGHGAPGRDELAGCPALADAQDEAVGLADESAEALGCELVELGFPARGWLHDLASLTPGWRLWRCAV